MTNKEAFVEMKEKLNQIKPTPDNLSKYLDLLLLLMEFHVISSQAPNDTFESNDNQLN